MLFLQFGLFGEGDILKLVYLDSWAGAAQLEIPALDVNNFYLQLCFLSSRSTASHRPPGDRISDCPSLWVEDWVEHDPLEIWTRSQDAIRGGMEKADLPAASLAAIGITNQRETVVVCNKNTGEPYHNAIVWQDTRTHEICDQLSREGAPDRFRPATGLPLSTYFSGPKIRWLLDNVEGLRDAGERGEANFGNIDTWLIWNLTGGPSRGAYVTDVTNANRTQLMDLGRCEWDP